MDKEYIKKLAEDPRFIPGIHNYCDRWCERCPLTCRCMNFALGEEQFGDPEARDINNKAFWQKLSETFQVTLETVKEAAKEQGIDLDSVDHGGKSCGSIRQEQPDRTRYKIPLITCRMSVVRGRPPGLAGGSKDSSNCHCSSVRLLRYILVSIPQLSDKNRLFVHFLKAYLKG